MVNVVIVTPAALQQTNIVIVSILITIHFI